MRGMQMIKIGEFSTLTGISIHMLRNYDKIGLLMPAHIDEESGYRYYKEEQIPIANQILVLKNLGFGLKEIACIQLEYDSMERIQEFLQEKLAEKQEEISRANEQMKKMQQAMREIEQEEMRSLSVVVKTIPPRTVASLRGCISRFEEEGILWTELGQLCEQVHIKELNTETNRYSYAITHHLEFAKDPPRNGQAYNIKEIDVEVQRVIEKLPTEKRIAEANSYCKQICSADRRLQFLQIPECEAATLAFTGKYSQLGDINQYMYQWVQKNGYQITGIFFVTYFLSPGNEPNPDNFVTEVCFPVQKIK